MSQRPGIAVTHMAPVVIPPWPDDTLPDPRSQRVHAVTAEVRVYWPTWATREQVEVAMWEMWEQAVEAMDEELPATDTAPALQVAGDGATGVDESNEEGSREGCTMTAPDVEAIQARHVRVDGGAFFDQDYCRTCTQPWPCDAAVLGERLAAVLAECDRAAADFPYEHSPGQVMRTALRRIRRAATGTADA